MIWDDQIEQNERTGRLDALIDRALEEHRAGRTRPLGNIIRRPTSEIATGTSAKPLPPSVDLVNYRGSEEAVLR